MSHQLLTAGYHHLTDLRQQLRAQQRYIVDQRLQLILARFVAVKADTVSQHLTHHIVMVGVILQAIKIAVQTLLEHR